MVKWTSEQLEAVSDRNKNLLVAAAAGSGKTAVLVERIIQLIFVDEVNIDELLVVTFTHAAAGEMRDRINQAIVKKLESADGENEHLRRQLNQLSRAAISTLHAFCTEVVREYFYLIDVDPNFRIASSGDTTLLKLEALDELFAREYEQGQQDFLDLVEIFGSSRDDTPLQELVLRVYDFIQSQPSPLQWLGEKVENFALADQDFLHNPWIKSIRARIQVALDAARDIFNEALQLSTLPGGPGGYHQALQDDLSLVDRLERVLKQDFGSLYDEWAGLKHTRLGKNPREVDPELVDRCKDLRDEGKKILSTIKSEYLIKRPEDCLRDLHMLYPRMQYLYKLVAEFSDLYQELKKEKALMDFNDLEHYALSILAHEKAAAEYRKRFKYIFVDEYQDSNLVQDTIINLIKRENNLFLVGDVKQSIYRFRLADPSLFLDKYWAFANSAEEFNRRIDLSMNFRSRDEIIQGVNFIFERIMSQELGEIDYDASVFLHTGIPVRHQEKAPVELLLIENQWENNSEDEGDYKPSGYDPNEEEPGEPENDYRAGLPNQEPVEEMESLAEMNAAEMEARLVARRIKQMYGQTFYDSKAEVYRPLDYRDMVILMRATRATASVFLETLLNEGIPAYTGVDGGYFEALEVKIFINLLQLIDNRRQDLPLLTVMRSMIGNFSLDELTAIRIASPAVEYFRAVEEYIDSHDDELGRKLREFTERLDKWQEQVRFSSMVDYIWSLFMETGYYYYCGAMPGGCQRQANLRVLLKRAQEFQAGSSRGLFHFIQFVDKVRNSSADMGLASITGENDNVVQIMSIHKSKGLEFPVVIIAGMGRKFNLQDTRAPVLLHKDLGIGPRFVDPVLRTYGDSIARIALKNQIKMDSLSEEMRILYVACTRARDRLIMVGSASGVEKQVRKWSRPVNPFNLIKGQSYLDWIGPVLMRHQDGKILRRLAGVEDDPNLPAHESCWRIEILNRLQIGIGGPQELSRDMDLPSSWRQPGGSRYSDKRDLVWERLNWMYPYRSSVSIPSKLAVTRIKEMNEPEQMQTHPNIPAMLGWPAAPGEERDIINSGTLAGLQKGTVVHAVMEHLDLTRVNTVAAIKQQVQSMVAGQILKEEEAVGISIPQIHRFFASELGQRVLNCRKAHREVPFNLLCKASEVMPGTTADDDLLIQGIIDLYFEEDDGLVLVDFKTDYVNINDPGYRQKIIDRYALQLKFYKEALEKILGQKVKASYLYMFYSGDEIKVG